MLCSVTGELRERAERATSPGQLGMLAVEAFINDNIDQPVGRLHSIASVNPSEQTPSTPTTVTDTSGPQDSKAAIGAAEPVASVDVMPDASVQAEEPQQPSIAEGGPHSPVWEARGTEAARHSAPPLQTGEILSADQVEVRNQEWPAIDGSDERNPSNEAPFADAGASPAPDQDGGLSFGEGQLFVQEEEAPADSARAQNSAPMEEPKIQRRLVDSNSDKEALAAADALPPPEQDDMVSNEMQRLTMQEEDNAAGHARAQEPPSVEQLEAQYQPLEQHLEVHEDWIADNMPQVKEEEEEEDADSFAVVSTAELPGNWQALPADSRRSGAQAAPSHVHSPETRTAPPPYSPANASALPPGSKAGARQGMSRKTSSPGVAKQGEPDGAGAVNPASPGSAITSKSKARSSQGWVMSPVAAKPTAKPATVTLSCPVNPAAKHRDSSQTSGWKLADKCLEDHWREHAATMGNDSTHNGVHNPAAAAESSASLVGSVASPPKLNRCLHCIVVPRDHAWRPTTKNLLSIINCAIFAGLGEPVQMS